MASTTYSNYHARLLDAAAAVLTKERMWWPLYLSSASLELWAGERGYSSEQSAWSVVNRRAEDCNTYVAVRFGTNVVIYGGKDFVLCQRDAGIAAGQVWHVPGPEPFVVKVLGVEDGEVTYLDPKSKVSYVLKPATFLAAFKPA
jgi:hypothetical protein